MEMLYGTVSAVIFQNKDNGYTVLRLCTQDHDTVTLVGTIPMAMIGERLAVTGKWGYHPSHGRHFEAELLERLMPDSGREILAFLSSRAIKGIGKKTAEKIVKAFGDSALRVLENEPERIAALPGITVAKAREISENFRKQVGMRRLIEFLSAYQLPANLAIRLYRAYGDLSVDALKDNPYLLTQPFFGGDFVQIDSFALALGIQAEDPRRVEAAILFELQYNQGNGHTFIPRGKLTFATSQLLAVEEAVVDAGISRLQEACMLVIDHLRGLDACYIPELYEAETYITERLCEMVRTKEKSPFELDAMIRKTQTEGTIIYAEKQLEAIRASATNRVLLITGGPGTGKTTTMSGILELFSCLGLKTLLAAPTGRAAKRLSECTGRPASTIHRLLETQFDPETGNLCFCHDEQTPLKADAIVVDEMSMVDVLLMGSLLRAVPNGCRLVLVGDPDQLPSVGPGNLFSDLIRSQVVPTIRLTEIFRQARESMIVMNAHAVNGGELPVLHEKKKDFFFLKRQTPEELIHTIRELCCRRIPDNLGIAPEDIQVLSPSKKNTVGTKNLNIQLQAVLNPAAPNKREKRHGDFSFREGDRVMQIRNNYDILWKKTDGTEVGSGVFNGDIGKILHIDPECELVTVCFDDREVSYDFAMLSELELAYAMTVHKSQGSEYRAVILTAWPGSRLLLTRNVLYTAITRARDVMIIVGHADVIAAMVANDRQTRRYSGLKLRLQQEADEK